MFHDGQSGEPAPVRLQIELQPETATRRWHAVVRTADGHYAKFELLNYYCMGVGTACVTFRYAYQGDGTRRLR